MTSIPTLTSERLILREWREEDFPAYAGMYADPDVAQYIGGVRDEMMAWRHFASHWGHWALRGFGMFVAEHKQTGEFVGFGGPWFPHGWPEPEVGYSITKACWRQGYASEILQRGLQFAYQDLGWSTATSSILPDNVGSQAVAAKCGGVYEKTMTNAMFGGHCQVWRYPGP